MERQCTLEISATGMKNPSAQGTEVWFDCLRRPDGSIVPLDEFSWDAGWDFREAEGGRRLFSSHDQPATLRWTGLAEGLWTLELGSHPWSGIATIRWNGREQASDLYSQGGRRVFELDAAAESGPSGKTISRPWDEAAQVKIISSAPVSMFQYAGPLFMARNLWSCRGLIRRFTVRDVLGRYKGSYLGLFWSFFTPLLMLAVYTFVFGYVFQSRWIENKTSGKPAAAAQPVAASGAGGRPAIDSPKSPNPIPPPDSNTVSERIRFALNMFCGLIVFGIFSECVSRAPGLIVGNPNYVKKVVFPLEILPVSILGSSLIHGAISLVLLLAGTLIFEHEISATLYLFPLVLASLIMLTLGVAWFLASLGVFVRDVGHTVGIVLTILFFMSAIFYPISSVGPPFDVLMRLNPLAILVEDARRTLIEGRPPNWAWWLPVLALSALAMQLGYVWFMKSKRWFSDVI